MTQREVIRRDQDILVHLDPERYPNLCHLSRKTKVMLHLNCIMDHMLTYRCPVWPESNRRYYLFSTAHLQEWSRENKGIRSSSKTWQGHTVFLEIIGLIKIIRVTGHSSDRFLDSLYTRAQERSRAHGWKKRIISETLWTVPPYTPELLAKADTIAKRYLDARINLSLLNKDDVIDISGQEIANRIYHDQRVVGQETQNVHVYVCQVIRAAVHEKGYATKAEIKERLEAALADEQHFTFPDPDRQHEWTPADLDEWEREKRYKHEVQKAMVRLRQFCGKCGCSFGPAKKPDQERFGVAARSWIIVPVERG